MQTKTTMSYHFIPMRIAISKKTVANVDEDVKKEKLSYTVGRNIN